jgi:hypothetical protein
VFLSNLEVIGSQTDEFGAPESATDQQRQDGTVTLAACRVQRRRLQQRSGLFDGQPIANPDSQSLRALNTPDSCGQLGAQQSRIRRLVSQSSHCRQPHIDGGGSKVSLFQEKPIPEYNRSIECQSWF